MSQSVALSDRELEIVKLVAQGYTNPEIGKILYLSPNSIKTHLRNVFNKLGVSNRLTLVLVLIKNNLIEIDHVLGTDHLNYEQRADTQAE